VFCPGHFDRFWVAALSRVGHSVAVEAFIADGGGSRVLLRLRNEARPDLVAFLS